MGDGFPTVGSMARIRDAVIDWFASTGRNFPWRDTMNPYHVLIAEALLRRTTAPAVLRVFPSFVKRFESIESLAAARPSTIEKYIESLGLQKVRARHLRQAAQIITRDYGGSIPSSMDALSSLPGIGRYLAAAIANFAFGEAVPMVDGNIVHLLRRVFNFDLRNSEDERAWEIMQQLGSPRHEKTLYWGIIDLVATVCLRKAPRCTLCPLRRFCYYSKTHVVH